MTARDNPFPGMNPWMQTVWSDAHTMLIGYIRDALDDELPDDLVARAEENISVNADRRRADVAIAELEPWKRGERPVWTPANDPDLASRLATPQLVEIHDVVERWIEIRSVAGDLVTVIELLSPAKKTRFGRQDFDSKVTLFLQAGVNVMEIDLIRGGRGACEVRSGGGSEEVYQIIVTRPERRHFELYPCPLRERLPAVRVPLREDEPDAALDLQPLIDRCYAKGRYWSLNYAEALEPPLAETDAAWANERLQAAGLI